MSLSYEMSEIFARDLATLRVLFGHIYFSPSMRRRGYLRVFANNSDTIIRFLEPDLLTGSDISAVLGRCQSMFFNG